jgi:hypothetical protein
MNEREAEEAASLFLTKKMLDKQITNNISQTVL